MNAPAQDSTPNAEFCGDVVETAESCFVLVLARALRCCGRRDLRNIVSVVILRDLREKICIRA